MSAWTKHLQQAYFDRSDIPTWTVEHPYDNPLVPVTRGLPRAPEPIEPLFAAQQPALLAREQRKAATAQQPAAVPGSLSVEQVKATPATVTPARQSRHRSLENVMRS